MNVTRFLWSFAWCFHHEVASVWKTWPWHSRGGLYGVAVQDPIVYKATPGIACGVNVPIVVVACPQIIPRVQHDAQHELVTHTHACHHSLRVDRGARESSAAPVSAGAATLPLIPRTEDITSWTRRDRPPVPYATIGLAGLDSGSTGWCGSRMEGEREAELKERTKGVWNCCPWNTNHEKTEGDGRCCTTCVQVASFRFASLRESSQGALVCSSFRVVSSFTSSGARVQAGHALLSHIYRPPVFPVLSARGIPQKLTIDPRESLLLIWLVRSSYRTRL